MSFGDRILSNSTIHLNKSSKPVCITFPGGLTEFCGRVYGIDRDQQEFKACLGLELRSFNDIEASLKVSCFRFGPNGLQLEPNTKNSSVSKLSNQISKKKIVHHEEDEYDDELFSFYDDNDNNNDNDINSDDVTAFSVVSDEFLGGFLFDTDKKKVKVNSKLKSTRTTELPKLKLPKKPSLNQNDNKNTSLSINSNSTSNKQVEFESVQHQVQPEPEPQPQPQLQVQTELSILDKVNFLNKKYSMDNRIRSGKLSSNRRQTKEMLTYSMTDLKNLGVKLNLSTH